jgi:hypothetical protein
MKPIDPLQLQRLVDGELDFQHVQQLLVEAETTPEQWKEIAVGFVENQTWNQAFQSRGQIPAAQPSVETIKRELDSDTKQLSLSAATAVSPNDRSSHSWWVMAASLLAAASIGYLISQIQTRDFSGSSVAQLTTGSSSHPDDPGSNSDSKSNGGSELAANLDNQFIQADPSKITQADYHLEVPLDEQNSFEVAGQSTSVPLYQVDNAQQLQQLNLIARQRHTPAISAEMLKRLTGSGYRMVQEVDYVSGRLEDGRSFVVPVRTIRFAVGQ